MRRNVATRAVPAFHREKEKFCRAHCEGLKGSVEITCQCGQTGCRGDITKI